MTSIDAGGAEQELTREQMRRNRARSSPRFVKYPEPLVAMLNLNEAIVLGWQDKFADPKGGYIDRIRASYMGDNLVVKGVDERVKRPFVAFFDDDEHLCVLFQRYQPGTTPQLAGPNPLWVGVSPSESKVFKEGWHAFAESRMDKFAERLSMYATRATKTPKKEAEKKGKKRKIA